MKSNSILSKFFLLVVFLSINYSINAQPTNCTELSALANQYEYSLIWEKDLKQAIVQLDSLDIYANALNCELEYASNKIRRIVAYIQNSETQKSFIAIKETEQYLGEKHLPEEEEKDIRLYLNYILGRYHNTIGNLNTSKQYYEKVIKLIDAQVLVGNEDNLYIQPKTLRQIGLILMGLGRFNEAIPYFEEALTYANKPLAIGITFNHLGESARKLKQFETAEAYYKQAYKAYDEYFEKNPDRRIKRRHNLIALLTASALCSMDKAKATNNPALLNLAENYLQKALNHLQTNDSYAHVTYRNFGDLKTQMGQLQEAENYYLKAIQITDSPWEKAKNNIKLGQLEYRKKSYQNSLKYTQQALSLLLKDENIAEQLWETPTIQHFISDPYLLEALSLRVDNLYQLSQGENPKKDYLKMASATINIGSETIDSILLFYQSGSDKERFITNIYSFFESALNVCYAQYKQNGDQKTLEAAFRYAEQSKAIVLRDLYIDNAGSSNIPEKYRERAAFFQTQLYSFKKVFKDQANTTNQIDDTGQSEAYLKLRTAYLAFQDTLNSLQQYKNARNEMAHWTIADVQSSLQENQSLLTYFIGQKQAYAFVLNEGTDLVMIQLGFSKKELESLVQSYFECMNHPQDDTPCYNDWVEHSHQLYQMIVEPVETHLKMKVAIIPDGALCSLPFSTLVFNPVSLADKILFSSLDYLLHKFTFSYNYSAFTRLNIQGDNESFDYEFMAIAPTFSNALAQIPSGRLGGKNLTPLLNGMSLIKQLNLYFDGARTILLPANDGTKANFKQYAPLARNIHIHTHGILEKGKYLSPFIAFHQLLDDREEDSNLYIEEFYGLKLKAAMVTLPVCHSAYGESIAGQGLVSIARGFIHAGVQSVFPSLWGGNDDALSEITVSFYQNIADKMDRDVAMQQAKIKYLNSHANKKTAFPYYWGCYIPIGNMEVKTTSLFSFWTLGGGFLLVGMVFLFILYRKT